MAGVVFSGEGALLEHHVDEEDHIVRLAVVENAGCFRGAIEQAVMILDGGNFQPFLFEDGFSLLDLSEIVV